MAVYTFSTPTKKPEDADVVAQAKELCANKCLNFSAVLVTLLREWNEKQMEAANDRAR